jgi:hypothetical protein
MLFPVDRDKRNTSAKEREAVLARAEDKLEVAKQAVAA